MPEFVSVELFKVKKCSKTSKGFEIWKLTAKPKVLENVKRSWKKSWKVMEFEELKRVRTLIESTLSSQAPMFLADLLALIISGPIRIDSTGGGGQWKAVRTRSSVLSPSSSS